MSLFNWRTWLFALPLVFLVGCTTVVGPNDGGPSGTVRVTIQGQFEKRALTSTGFGALTTLPIRHSYMEVRQVSGNTLLASGYTGTDGTAYLDVAPGTQLYATIYAEYEVPGGSATTDFFGRGGVINQPFDTTAGFTVNDEWSVTSSNVTANSAGTLTVTATASSRIAGAFNINDQMLTQGLKLSTLEPSLRLPSLFTYWSTNSNPAHQQRGYPYVLKNGSQVVLSSGRAIFTQSLNGLQGGGANTETDEWDDSVIQEYSAHMLFADYSLKADGSNSLSLLRRDNDNVYVSRYRPSESTVAFVGGFCDFLAGAVRNNPLLLDSYVNNNGILQVENFDLGLHGQIVNADRPEFTRGAVAVSLWGIWKNSMTGDTTALTTLWQAVRSSASLPDGSGEYTFATLGCYPSYLLGVKSRVSAGAWTSAVGQLGLESIPEPTPAYFTGTRLWGYFPGAGTLVFRESTDPYLEFFFEPDQSRSYRFTQTVTGSRTITLNGGTGMWIELLGPGGYFDGSFSENSTQTITHNLTPGVYVARVRVRQHDSQTQTPIVGSRNYTISVN
jgi:hypothetical protein